MKNWISNLMALGWIALSWQTPGAPVLGEWVPIFKGVEHSVSTNLSAATGFPNRNVVHGIKVDLTDPDIRFTTTPRYSNYTVRANEVGAYTVSDFLKNHQLQVAINANFFGTRDYYLAPGTPMDLLGFAMSEGVIVSPQDSAGYSAALFIDKSNHASIVYTNWPAADSTGVYNAVSGYPTIVLKGTNLPAAFPNSQIYDRTTAPRTAFGISKDKRYLYLVTIDGRQSGYSTGSTDAETAGWMLLLGAYDAINMDGGGSTTLVMEDSTGKPLRLNKPSAVADSGKERTVGSHLGLFAKPLPGFINDVVAVADDTTARIGWTTLQPATGQVRYGLTTNFTDSTAVQTNLTTDHTVNLSGLLPRTGYYFQIISKRNAQTFTSPSYYLVTSNYVTTNLVFGVDQSWKYSPTVPGSTSWTSPVFDDSDWAGPSPGLLWADTRAAGPNPLVQPKATQLPIDASTGYPYVTYYFRTHFQATKVVPGGTLTMSAQIDDGAIFYLNGIEIYRLRMPADAVDGSTVATTFPCEGDASCMDEIEIPASSLGSLVEGDNVLAVEVHNYNVRSADITFGLSLNEVLPVERTFKLAFERVGSGNTLQLAWNQASLILQSSPTLTGPWTDLPQATSPFLVTPTQKSGFFRLRR